MYILSKTILGLAALAHMTLTSILFISLQAPEIHHALSLPSFFLPFVVLFCASGAVLCTGAMLLVSPFVTNGEETMGMPNPFSHPSGYALLLIAIMNGPLFLMARATQSWQAPYITSATQHLLMCAAGALLVVFISFYGQRRRQQLSRIIRNIEKLEARKKIAAMKAAKEARD